MYVDFLSSLHRSVKRDYLARMTDPEYPKAKAIEIAKRYDRDYWDGDRRVGYGGYRYDGRWRAVARAMAAHYGLKAGARILDVGCGKGFLLHEFTQEVPGVEVRGIDISSYAIENSKEEVRPFLSVADATKLPFPVRSFDLVVSITTLHNLFCDQLVEALQEIERVGKAHKYIVVESYRNEQEKVNLMCWVLTGECFLAPREWEWFFRTAGYAGDHSFITFE